MGEEMRNVERPAAKRNGVPHFFDAFRFSLWGMQRIWKETAFRHQLFFAGASLALFVAVGATLTEFLIMAMICLFVFAIEALNTAVEEIIDRISPEISSTGKHAKDLGSFAVFCVLIAGGLFVAWVVFT